MNYQPIPLAPDIHKERQIEPLIASLVDVLKTEIDLQRELQHFLEDESLFLRRRPEADQLLENNKNKEKLLCRAMTLEDVIAQLLGSISRLELLPGHRITLSDLTSFAPPPLQGELQTCRNILTPLVTKNRELNEGNRDVIDTLLQLVNNSMRVISNLMTADSDYVGTGGRNPARMAGTMVCLKG